MTAAVLHSMRGGPATGPTLVFVPPMGADLRFWDECREILQSEHDCLAVDLRGSGATPGDERPFTIDAHAADLSAMKERLALERIVPIGCAVGSMVAAAFAARHRGDCAALVLSNPGLRTLPQARHMLARRAAAVREGGIAAILPGAVDAAFEGCPDDARRATHLERLAAQDPEDYARQIEAILEADVSTHLRRISCPSLLVAGGRDKLLPPAEHAYPAQAIMEGAELAEIPEAAHFIPYQRPEAFAALVSAFLDRHLRPRAGAV